MSKGYVYVLSNPCMPGIVKIGKTTRSVEDRANELYQTGVPEPFKVEEFFHSPDCHELEASLTRRSPIIAFLRPGSFSACPPPRR